MTREEAKEYLGNYRKMYAELAPERFLETLDIMLNEPSLPSNLDEAAENRVTENGRFEITSFEKMRIEDIMFGAEWMAAQGVTKEAVIGMATEEISINVSQETLNELDLCPGNKVVVQIRKK